MTSNLAPEAPVSRPSLADLATEDHSALIDQVTDDEQIGVAGFNSSI